MNAAYAQNPDALTIVPGANVKIVPRSAGNTLLRLANAIIVTLMFVTPAINAEHALMTGIFTARSTQIRHLGNVDRLPGRISGSLIRI